MNATLSVIKGFVLEWLLFSICIVLYDIQSWSDSKDNALEILW